MKSNNYNHFKLSSLALAVTSALLNPLQSFAAQNEALEEIQITGTRIRATDGMVAPTPVTSVTTTEIMAFDPGTSISEQLDNLPQFLGNQTAQRGGSTLFGDAGGSYLNLRNMGKQRTLVLFDGSRIVPADRASTVNVDNFPTALVRTIDVVTGGASAAYGADALAGVVNFVLDREFEGFKSSVSTGITERLDGQNWSFSVAGGKQIGDRLNVIGSLEARDVKQINRDPWDTENWNSIGWVINPAWAAAAALPASNSARCVVGTYCAAGPQRITAPNVHSSTQTAGGLITAPGFILNRYTFSADGKSVRPFIVGDIAAATGTGSNGMQAGGPEAGVAEKSLGGGANGAAVVQRSGFGAIKYALNDDTEVFAQVMLGRTESNTYDRLSSFEMGQGYFGTIYVENAFLPVEVRNAMVAANRTSFELQKIGQPIKPQNFNIADGRDDKNISQMWSASSGFDHIFANDWSLRGNYQYGESKLTSAAYNILRIDRLHMAIDAVRDPATGAIVCNVQRYNPTPQQLAASMAGKTVATTDQVNFPNGIRTVDSPIFNDNAIRDCVPINIFGEGNATQAGQDYVLDDKKGHRDLDQHFAEVLLTGDLYEGWGPGPVSFAAGLTYREEWFNQLSTPIGGERSASNAPEIGIRGMSAGTTGGNRSVHYFSATSWATGAFDVWEWFSEVNVPVWEAGSGNQRLDTTFAFRRSDYSHSGEIDSWKLGAEVQLIDGLRFRATKSRDVREPTFGEQFESGGGGANITDPLLRTSYTITALSGGNPDLKPERANTLTAGIVWEPNFADWINGFQVSADWYEIDVRGRVGSLGAQRILDDCLAGDAALCTLVFRNAATRVVERVLNVNLNVAAALTSGVDLEARYDKELDFFSNQEESMSFRLFAGYLDENSITTTTYRDDVGSTSSPEWNATATVGYRLGPYGVSMVGRYRDSALIGSGTGTSGAAFWREGVDVDDNTIPSNTVANLVFSYRGETSNAATWNTNFNMTNVFDREPPITPSQSQRGGQQGISNTYDAYGRRYQLSLNYNF
ncbi:MAG: TonB-dependent receptor domain-containing protein [Pseudohongiellaceae bacterium]